MITPLRLISLVIHSQYYIIKCDENIDEPNAIPVLINTDKPGYPTATAETGIGTLGTYKIEAGEQHKTTTGTIHVFRIAKALEPSISTKLEP